MKSLRFLAASLALSAIAGLALVTGCKDGGGGEEWDSASPTWPTGSALTASDIGQTSLRLDWNQAEDNLTVTGYRVYQDSAEIASVSGEVTGLDVSGLVLGTRYTFEVQAGDEAGNWSMDGPSLTVFTASWIPLDPATIAPPLDRTVATNLASAVEFLYTGDDPIQRGVAPGTIKALRVAVLRGRVRDEDGQPVPGVKVNVLDHPEYGWTATREDGVYDLAVNGGKHLVASYRLGGFLPVQRKIRVPWQDYVELPDVVMVPPDSKVTAVELSQTAGVQVARGPMITDAHGSRQATLVVPTGVTAQLKLPDGGGQTLSGMSVRATEFTIGDDGAERMPARLPPASAYTYALDLSLDEAVDGADVEFNEPAYFYVENFLDFPVGSPVPMGYYDDGRGVWVPSESGRIIEVVGTTGGKAAVDVDGDGVADEGAALAELKIIDEELEKLASMYEAGTSLWRVGITHLSEYDANWGFFPPEDAGPPADTPESDNEDDGCQAEGSMIDVHNQVLGEDVPLTGLPFGLHYRSDRVPGRKADYSLRIPLRSPDTPSSVKGIELDIRVAGQQHELSFDADPDPATQYDSHLFTWDGLDRFGRPVQGAQPITVLAGYTYDGVYQQTETFGDAGTGTMITGSQTRREVTLWSRWNGRIGAWDARPQGLGGWSPSVHHVYDPVGRTLYRGDGRKRSAEGLPPIIATVAGDGDYPWDPDTSEDQPATAVSIGNPLDVVQSPAGQIFIALDDRILRVGIGGSIRTFAGGGEDRESDGIMATEADLFGIDGIDLGPDGSLYLADTYNDRVRRISPDGTIATVAGTGIAGFSGDGGPAIEARLDYPVAVAMAPDGNLYIADQDNHVVRRMSTDGRISTFAGTPGEYSNEGEGDGGPAREALLGSEIADLDMGPDGSLYIAGNWSHRVRRISPNGIITTVAGTGEEGDDGDGGPATDAKIEFPMAVAVGPDGSLYIASESAGRIRRVGPDGIITTVAGDGTTGYLGDKGPARKAQLDYPGGLAVGPDGKVYIADYDNYRVRRVGPVLSGYTGLGDIVIAAEDGGEVFVFDADGRHRNTLHPLTGAELYSFTYDAAGRLAAIEDADGNVTTIERETSGDPIAIHPPFALPTQLGLDADGYLEGITDPAGNAHRFTYHADGLMESMTDPNGGTYSFEYDAKGRLTKDSDPAGGYKTLVRTTEGIDDGYAVALTTALDRTTHYRSEREPNGDRLHLTAFPGGSNNQAYRGKDGSVLIRFTDKTESALQFSADPRWGMNAPLVEQFTTTTPDGLQGDYRLTRDVLATDESDPLSFTAVIDAIYLNDREYVRSYSRSMREWEVQTPTGRQIRAWLDVSGRPLKAEVANSSLVPVEYAYDEHGRLTATSRGTGTDERVHLFGYDDDGHLASVTDPMGRTVAFDRDDAGRVARATVPDGREIGFTYDNNGNITSITPAGRPAHLMGYTPVDDMDGYDPPDAGVGSDVTTYEYNLDRQLEKITRPGGEEVVFSYNLAGRISSVDYPQGKTTMGYDSITGQLQDLSTADGIINEYTYDGFLMLEEMLRGPIYGVVERTYNNDFNLESLSCTNCPVIQYGYDEDDLLTSAGEMTITRDADDGLMTGTVLDGVTTAIGYNGFGEVGSYLAEYGGGSAFETGYVRDGLGRIVEKTETIEGTTARYEYVYDDAGRLTEVSRDDTTISAYTYDTNSNRIGYSGEMGDATGTYDDQDRMLSYGNATYTYTDNGELLTRTAAGESTTYGYDALGNLREVNLPGSRTITYLIDGRNRRIGKEVDGALVQGFLYAGQLNPVAELDGNGDLVSVFVYGSRINVPDYMMRGGVVYRIVSDHLGSPRLVVNASSGEVVQRMDYDEFGRVLNDTNPGFQPFGFAGGIYDRDTGLVRFGARDYDPETGRWTAKDPVLFLGGQLNLYGYVASDPVNWVDPYGLTVTCEYSQSTGQMTCTDDTSGQQVINESGYSGHGAGVNNPALQNQRSVGPLPRGSYSMGSGQNRARTGPVSIFLNPAASNSMFGRSGFFIHGDNSQGNQSASRGCVIMSRATRNAISQAGGGTLNVAR